MATEYSGDVVTWANEQAQLLRRGSFSALDVERLAVEIEDVGNGVQRDFASRVTMLLAQLLKWRYMPERRGDSWKATLGLMRGIVARRLQKTSSLKHVLADADAIQDMWNDALLQAAEVMYVGMASLPSKCPWSMGQALSEEFYPD
ncbi:DUF29 domain-containing protein [Burkholderia cenocepacia]|uniref:DUF29 domain-containing protein n=1 Tax=Burkholderia cenocepacia TaxID=95486 RepID=UPI001B950D2C|nr:DUF29 domain-containing protein [Burkholderia cenocepacia]MBR8043130.1 DUF29 domain-containing protein [Burkholderia cenocepacia]MBR8324500.1 DUF29 domain-containing protein [Burkholderia cenocepacia]